MFIPFVSYKPNLNSRSSTSFGMLSAATDMIPVNGGGFVSYPAIDVISNAVPGAGALAGYHLHRFTTSTLYSGYIHFVGTGIHATDNYLYYLSPTGGASSASVWTAASRTTGGAYANSAFWRFSSFGNICFAVNKLDTPQYVIGTAFPFANLTAMPKCSHIVSTNDFVFIASTNEATYGDQTDRWWCSAIGDYTKWTPDIATQCVTNRLVDTPGNITGLAKYGDSIIIFKETSMYRAEYVGPPHVWRINLVSDSVGLRELETFGSQAIEADGRLFWISNTGHLYNLDSGYPRRILNVDGSDVYIGESYSLVVDLQGSCFHVSRNQIFGASSVLSYNYNDGRFGGVFSLTPVGQCFSDGTLEVSPCSFSSDRKLYSYVNPSTAISYIWAQGSIKTGFIGDANTIKLFRSLRPIVREAVQKPTLYVTMESTLANSVDTDLLTTDVLTLNSTTEEFQGLRKFKWARFTITSQVSPYFSAVIDGIDVDIVPAGKY